MRALLMVIVMVAAVLSGCIDDDAPNGNDTVQSPGDNDVGDVVEDTRMDVLATVGDVPPVVRTETGAKDPTAGFCGEASCPRDIYELLDDMEEGVAYQLQATLTWEETPTSQTVDSPVFLLLIYSAGVRGYSGTEYTSTEATVEATLLAKNDGNSVSLQVGWNFGGDESSAYQLDYTLTPIQDVVPQFSAASVTVPEGAALVIETQNGNGRAVVYDGADELVGTINVTVPASAPAGAQVGKTTAFLAAPSRQEFVVITMDAMDAKLYVRQGESESPPLLRHLPTVLNREELGTINGGGVHTFTFDLPAPATQVGFWYGANCVPGDCYNTDGASWSLANPGGVQILEGMAACNPGPCGGYAAYYTNFNDGPNVKGAYTLTWDSESTQGVVATAIWYGYERS